MGEGIGLSGTRAGDDQQRAVVRPCADAMKGGGTLGVVEGVEVGGQRPGGGLLEVGWLVHGHSFAVILYSKGVQVNPQVFDPAENQVLTSGFPDPVWR